MVMQSLPVRVLLIVDDEDDYLLIRDLLSDVSYLQSTLKWVADYETALDAMKGGKYDVCLLDHRIRVLTDCYELAGLASNRSPPKVAIQPQ